MRNDISSSPGWTENCCQREQRIIHLEIYRLGQGDKAVEIHRGGGGGGWLGLCSLLCGPQCVHFLATLQNGAITTELCDYTSSSSNLLPAFTGAGTSQADRR